MIDLNFKTGYLNYEKLTKEISEYDIYAYYLGNFEVGRNMNSPFRRDDNPSFGVFVSNKGNLMFNDYKLGSGNCLKFVMMMENCSWRDAYHILNHRYKLGYITVPENQGITVKNEDIVLTNNRKFEKKDVWISIKLRQWSEIDKEYWSKYSVSLSTLRLFNVLPIMKFYLNYHGFNCEQPAYAYRFDTNVYKIYQPYSKNNKWYSNIKDKEIYQGHYQLPETGDILFITSSLKDVMVLYEAGYNAVAPHTEHQILSESLFIHYQSKFRLMTVLYDNDEAGILHANKMTDKFGLKSIYVPIETGVKDPSDYVEKYGLNKLKQWINNIDYQENLLKNG